MQHTIQQFKTARRVSAPLLAIKTADQQATIQSILGSYEKAGEMDWLQWDCVRGLGGLNKQSKATAAGIGGPEETVGLPETLARCLAGMPGADANRPSGAILFILNAHRWIEEAAVSQAIGNLREEFKADRRTLVLLAPEIALPAELQGDVLIIDEPMPSEAEVRGIVSRTVKEGGVKVTAEAIDAAINATLGMPAFPTEQVVAMALTEKGIDGEALWERKRQAVEQTPGLKVWRGDENFDQIAGLSNIKKYMRAILTGAFKPRVIVYIDEIEKQLAGASGDSSGTTQDQIGETLKFMQNEKTDGVLLLGPAGTGKSVIAKASANLAATPCIEIDFGGMKNRHVGDSEAAIRTALKVIKAIGQDRILFVATCNAIGVLPPELRRRFKSGTFFVDLPDAEERAALWQMYIKRAGVPKQAGAIPASIDWTGAEIEQCCAHATRYGTTLAEAASYIVPVAKSAAESIQALRQSASGRFISASKPGLYEAQTAPERVGRAAVKHGEEI